MLCDLTTCSLSQPRSAEGDCNKALSKEPGNVKALYRRGLARKVGQYSLLSLIHVHVACTKSKNVVHVTVFD